MIISTSGMYAIGLMMDLAAHKDAGPVKLKDVACRQGISLKYLETISGELKKAGLVTSYRGANGGYKIRYAPKEYTVGMILMPAVGNVLDGHALQSASTENASEMEYAAGFVCEHIRRAVSKTTDSITLQDLLDWQDARKDHYII